MSSGRNRGIFDGLPIPADKSVSYLPNSISPFQAEAEALLRAEQAVHSRQIEECTFLSNCQLLVKTFQGTKTLKAAQVVDWRSYHTMQRIALLSNRHPLYRFVYIPRDENSQAHILANLSRVNKISEEGYTYPLYMNL